MVGKEKLEACEDHQKESGVIKIFSSLKEVTSLFSVRYQHVSRFCTDIFNECLEIIENHDFLLEVLQKYRACGFQKIPKHINEYLLFP